MRAQLAALALAAGACGQGPRLHDHADASSDAGRADASADARPYDSGGDASPADAGADAGADADAAPFERVSGGCWEVATVEGETDVPPFGGQFAVSDTPEGFIVLATVGKGGLAQCILFLHDLDGALISQSPAEGLEGCPSDPKLAVASDGTVLIVSSSERVWLGTTDGAGEFIDDPGWLPIDGASTIQLTAMGDLGVLVADRGRVARLDWSGRVVAEILDLPWDYVASWVDYPGVAWSGEVVGVATRDLSSAFMDRIYFQRFDEALEFIDPAPVLVWEFDELETGDLADDHSVLAVGWDGSEFAVFVAWWPGIWDWLGPYMTDVFRYGEAGGESLGNFPLDRWEIDSYEGNQIAGVFNVADRVVLVHDAFFWTTGGDGRPAPEWAGIDFAPIDLSTGLRVAEDGRGPLDWWLDPMARNGTRIGIAWVEIMWVETEDGDEFFRRFDFTVIDCSAVFEGDG